MAKKARNEIAAGVFVLLGLATALAVILWLTPSLFEKPVATAFFSRSHAAGPAGLKNGSVVFLGDLKIGQIRYLTDQPEQKRTLYVVDLLQDKKFYDNGVAEVPFVLVGDMSLTVRGPGDPNGHLTSEAYPMPITGGLSAITENVTKATADLAKATQMLTEQLDANRAGALMQSVNETVGNVKAITVSIRGEMDPNRAQSIMSVIKDAVAQVHEIADKLVLAASGLQGELDPNRKESMLATVSRIFTNAEPKVEGTLTDVRATAGAIRGYTEKDVKDLLASLHTISGDVGKASANLAELSEKAKGIVDRNSGNVDEMVQNFVLVSANLKATATEVRRSPWRLLYQPSDKEQKSANILDAARAFSSGAIQLDQTVTRLGAIDPRAVSAEELKKLHDQLEEAIGKFTKAEQSLFKELGEDK